MSTKQAYHGSDVEIIEKIYGIPKDDVFGEMSVVGV